MRELTEKEWRKVDEMVEKCGCSIAEAKEMILADAEVDENPTAFNLPKELEKGAKKARRADRKATGNTRKADDQKRNIIQHLATSLAELNADNVTLTNIERQIDFEVDGRKLRIVLSAPRL